MKHFQTATLLCALLGCSSSETQKTSDAGTGNDASEGDALSSSGEPGAKAINGCSIGFQDQTAASSPRILNWDLPVANSPARCMKIKVGQSVKWQGSFQFHPLAPKDGDTPNPIAAFTSSTETEHTVTFSAPGTFGFVCTAHASMVGAIYVVP